MLRVESLRLEWIEALIDGDAVFTEPATTGGVNEAVVVPFRSISSGVSDAVRAHAFGMARPWSSRGRLLSREGIPAMALRI